LPPTPAGAQRRGGGGAQGGETGDRVRGAQGTAREGAESSGASKEDGGRKEGGTTEKNLILSGDGDNLRSRIDNISCQDSCSTDIAFFNIVHTTITTGDNYSFDMAHSNTKTAEIDNTATTVDRAEQTGNREQGTGNRRAGQRQQNRERREERWVKHTTQERCVVGKMCGEVSRGKSVSGQENHLAFGRKL
jgi:hypothetical protein